MEQRHNFVTIDGAVTSDDQLLVERVRAALYVVLACAVFLGIADLGAGSGNVTILLAVRLAQAVMVGVGLATLRPTPSRQRTIAVGLTASTFALILMGTSDLLRGQVETVALAAVVLSMGTATLLPWGTRPQVYVAIMSALVTGGGLLIAGRSWPDTVGLFTRVAAAVAVSIYLAREFAEYRARNARSEAILDERVRLQAMRADVRDVTPDPTATAAHFQAYCEAVVRHLDAAFARLWTVDGTGTTLELRASAGCYTHIDGPHARVPVGQFKIGTIAAQRRPHLTNDVAHDPLISDEAWARREGMVAFAGYPLLAQGRLLGVVALFARHRLSDAAMEVLGSVAETIALHMARAEAEAARAAFVEQLERTSRLKSEFVSIMSHELRTPINVIMGYVDMLRDAADARAHDALLDRIAAASRDLNEMLEGTLDISRMEVGRDTLRLEEIDIGTFWETIAVRCARLPIHPGVRLEWQPILGHGRLRTDPHKLATIVRNLVGNALKFTQAGSVRVEATLRADVLTLCVQDSGIGIHPDDHALIFDMFRQVDGSDSRRHGGTGLGLYIVRSFVEQFGGTVTLDSVPGAGARFTVTLPPQGLAAVCAA